MRDVGSRIGERGSSAGIRCLFLALTLCRGPRQTSHQDSEGTDVATRSSKIGPGGKTGNAERSQKRVVTLGVSEDRTRPNRLQGTVA